MPDDDEDEEMDDDDGDDGESEEDDDDSVPLAQIVSAQTEDGDVQSSGALQTQSSATDLTPLADILNYLVHHGGIEFFMYALPGEPHTVLPDTTWDSLCRLSDSLQGLYIELVGKHWTPFLSSRFANLRYLRLFLDTDDFPGTTVSGQRSDPNVLLLDFLHSHPLLEVLHIYLGTQFPNLSLANVSLPHLRSFLLISKAANVNIATFVSNHTNLVALDIFTDAEIQPFPSTALSQVRSLQVSALTIGWFRDVLAAAPRRSAAHQIHHLQITAARQSNLEEVLSIVAPVGPTLRCLELIFWTRESDIHNVLASVMRVFPNLVELSLFIPSWSVQDDADPGPPAPFELVSPSHIYLNISH